MPKIIQGKFKIRSNKKTGPGYFKMTINALAIAKTARPGQFVHLLCQEDREPLLRRPLSFHCIGQNEFALLYRVVGPGTNILAKLRPDDKIDVLGPLGNGFNFQRTTHNAQRTTILVAGGMGVAPLFALAQELADSLKCAADKKKILVLIGAKNKQEVICVQDFQKLGVQVQVATDDGTKGYKGLVTNLLKNLLRTTNHPENDKRSGAGERRTTIYTCGPKPMLKAIAKISQRFNIAAQGSLEENIACGVGACLGCAIKTKQGYQRVCKDGPVFDLAEITW